MAASARWPQTKDTRVPALYFSRPTSTIDADFRRRSRVGAAAGLAVEADRLDDANVGRHTLGRLEPLGARLLDRQRDDLHRPGLPDDLVGAQLCGAGLLGCHRASEVDRGHLGAEVEGDRLGARDLDEGLRQQVLAVVLLGVVVPALRIDPAVDALRGERTLEDVQHLAVLLDDRQHPHAVEAARVPRLAAALGVEGGPVEDHGGVAVVLDARDDAGVELEQRGVVEVAGAVVVMRARAVPCCRCTCSRCRCRRRRRCRRD